MADKKEEKAVTIKNTVDNKLKARTSRRGFIKKALISAVAVTATAGLAKKTASLIPEGNLQDKYLDDVLPGDKILAKREYVLMTKEEKEELIKTFADNYKKA